MKGDIVIQFAHEGRSEKGSDDDLVHVQLIGSVYCGALRGVDLRIYCKNGLPPGERLISVNGQVAAALGLFAEMLRAETADFNRDLRLARNEIQKSAAKFRIKAQKRKRTDKTK
jgi:hypothetical protein